MVALGHTIGHSVHQPDNTLDALQSVRHRVKQATSGRKAKASKSAFGLTISLSLTLTFLGALEARDTCPLSPFPHPLSYNRPLPGISVVVCQPSILSSNLYMIHGEINSIHCLLFDSSSLFLFHPETIS